MSEVADTSVRRAEGQGKSNITCTQLNYPQHHFHAKFHVCFFSEHIEEKIRSLQYLEILSQLHDPTDEVLKFIQWLFLLLKCLQNFPSLQ